MLDSSKLDKGSILIGLEPKMQKKLQYRRYLIEMCKDIAAQNNKKSYIPFFKTIMALFVLTNELGVDAYFTYNDINDITGLSNYYIKECLQLLSKDNVVRLGELSYYEDGIGNIRCRGRNIDLNGLKLYEMNSNDKSIKMVDETSQ